MPSTNKMKSCGRRKRLRYFESTTDLIARKLITYGEEFNHNQVHTLLLSLKSRKSLAHSKLRCEPDGIRLKRASKFGPPPPRKFYPYKDIERYYVFDNDPTILILGCVDHEQHSRYYDFFKLPESHYKDITTLINKARSHSDYILNEDDTTLPTPGVYSSHSSLNVSNEQLSQNNISMQETINLNQNNEVPIDNLQQTSNDNITNASNNNLQMNGNYSLEIQQNIDDTIQQQQPIDKDDVIIHDHDENYQNLDEPKMIKCEFEPCDEPIENMKIVDYTKVSSTSSQPNNQKVIHENSDDDHDDNNNNDDNDKNSLKIKFNELKEKDKTFAKLTENINVNDLSAVDFRYVSTNPDQGNRIVDNGDIYIFIAHYKRPENIKNFIDYNNYIDETETEQQITDKIYKKHHSTADKSFSLRYI
ncbi:uncharacterized protein DC041_0011979 [Schistosoma bovis]|uniref:Trematode PH-like domain-containing protein n=1 Tax=Schistosoma bovis TaxID=6184 RepID=A0A430QHX6_SCHBO|nr:uncharacterized protein DC041_0011979 [Schistosoma bovis]